MESVELMKKFVNQNKGLFIAYFIANIITLFLETIILSYYLSKIFETKKLDMPGILKFICAYSLVKIGYVSRSFIYDIIVPKYYSFLRTELFNSIVDRYKIDYKDLNPAYILYNFQTLPLQFNKLTIELLQEYIPDIIAVIICIVFLFFTDKYIGIIAITGVLLFAITMYARVPENIKLSEREHRIDKDNNEYVHDKFNNLFNIYTSGTEITEKDKNMKEQKILEDTYHKSYRYNTESQAIFEFIGVVITLIIFVRSLSVKKFIFVILVTTRYASYLSRTAQNLANLIDVLGYLDISDKFINELQNDNLDNQFNKQNYSLSGNIKFENVKFSFEGNDNLFDNLTFDIKNKKKIAIFGKSGSGKSTLVKLLLGFYTLNSGIISLDGINIKDMAVSDLRKNIAFVNQTVKIFDGSIISNILYGSKKTKEYVVKQYGNLLDIFKNLDHGLDTIVEVNGSLLSGGQKQVISILRALLKDCSVVVLDEPTIGLDKNTKKLLLDKIDKIDKTIIYITHDNDIKPHVDEIYELVKGSMKKIK
jgi:ABC-type bacteriocin/lantibiotic exporter with double-glycine peptidase domain